MVSSKDVEWKPVPGWGGLYEVSSAGQIRSLGRTRVRISRGRRQTINYPPRLLSAFNCLGYPSVTLRDGGRREKLFIHRAVCEAWHGPPPSGCEVAHNDGSRTNNTPANLRWATRAENMRDKITHGTALGRDQQPQAKITTEELQDILDRMDAGERNCDIWKHYPQVSRNYVSLLRSCNRPWTLDVTKRKKGLRSGST